MTGETDVTLRLARAKTDDAARAALADVFRRNRLEDGEGPRAPERLADQVLGALCDEDLFLVAEVGGLRFTVEVVPGGGLVIHASGWDDDQWREVGRVQVQ